MSKIAQENMEVFVDVWETQVDELGKVLRNLTTGGDINRRKCFSSKDSNLTVAKHFGDHN